MYKKALYAARRDSEMVCLGLTSVCLYTLNGNRFGLYSSSIFGVDQSDGGALWKITELCVWRRVYVYLCKIGFWFKIAPTFIQENTNEKFLLYNLYQTFCV